MPLIPPRRVEPRDTVALRLDRAVHERLEQYADFIQSPKDYVVAHLLQRLFRSDREFATWLASHPEPRPVGEPDEINPAGAMAAAPDTTNGVGRGSARPRRAGRRSGQSAPRAPHTHPHGHDHDKDEADGASHVPHGRSGAGPREESRGHDTTRADADDHEHA